MHVLSLLWFAGAVASADSPPVVRIDRDNVEITESCTIEITANPIADADSNGVVHIAGDNLTIRFKPDANHLHGAAKNQPPDSFAGTGITLKGTNIAIRGVNVSGYRIGIHAVECDGLTIDNVDVSGNFQQRLKSTPKAEDASDWLWPHANDNHEWITNYGTGICIEKSNGVTLSNITAHHGQNGIILDRVNESKIYDCDCSFLSGWGLAMWRSNKNVISRNSFDFCIRGYSHGVYNRGQDSAGILMFEQCCENHFEDNSATHCGDGFFGFAGKEALGEVNPRDDLDWYRRRGCNDNDFRKNDFSDSAAHGLELTFSFGNEITECRFARNAICGIWGGYSQWMNVTDNVFRDNGAMGHGQERGGINVEHGAFNLFGANRFHQDVVGISLWWDQHKSITSLPWVRANGDLSRDSRIMSNSFVGNQTAIRLRETSNTRIGRNMFDGVDVDTDADGFSKKALEEVSQNSGWPKPNPDRNDPLGFEPPQNLTKRISLAGRENIIMTEWGPWDHQSPLLQFLQRFDHADEYQLRGAKSCLTADQITFTGDVVVAANNDRIFVRPKQQNTILPYSFSFEIDGQRLSASGALTGGTWEVWTFASACDPREDAERWRREGTATHHTLTADDLDFRFGSGGMSEARHLPVVLPRDHFGVIATRSLAVPKGKWRIKTTSDDGIRVWMGDQLVIDDWTWHGPKEISHDFDVTEPCEVQLRVEFFELDGNAVLSVAMESRE